jgi:hypothetical protein
MLVEEGFLSPDVQSVRRDVHARYAPWYALFRDTNRRANEIQPSIEIHPDKQRELYGATLFARIIASSQGAVLLLELGLVAQARCVLRASLEALFSLAALAKSPEVIERLVASHEAEQRRAARNVGLWKDPALRAVAEREKASGRLSAALASTAVGISAYELAVIGDNEDLYRTLYMSLSWSVHSAAMDLERHMDLDGSGTVIGLRNEPDLELQETSWLVAVLVEIQAIGALAAIFPNIDVAQTEEYERVTKRLAEGLES